MYIYIQRGVPENLEYRSAFKALNVQKFEKYLSIKLVSISFGFMMDEILPNNFLLN